MFRKDGGFQCRRMVEASREINTSSFPPFNIIVKRHITHSVAGEKATNNDKTKERAQALLSC